MLLSINDKDMIKATEDRGILLKFLPPYSSGLNPVEKKWLQAKAIREKPRCDNIDLLILKNILIVPDYNAFAISTRIGRLEHPAAVSPLSMSVKLNSEWCEFRLIKGAIVKKVFGLIMSHLLVMMPVWADGDWDRARTAHERGDYTAELVVVRPLAEKGFAFAQFNLGVLYDNGQGVPEDDRQAIIWYEKAAMQGLTQAQVNLGIMYQEGEGTARDYVKAYFWFAMAKSQGDEQASEGMRDIAKKMTPAQIQEAKQDIKVFKASHTFSIPPLSAPYSDTLHNGNK